MTRRRFLSKGIGCRSPLKTVIAITLLVVACGSPGEVASGEGLSRVDVTTLDGRLHIDLPGGFVIHRHGESVQATLPDGVLRYHVSHHGGGKLLRLVGSTKGVLTRHQWVVVREKHFEQAIELKLTRGATGVRPRARRTIWFVPVAGRFVICDGIVRGDADHSLGDSFRELCTRVKIREVAKEP